MQLVKPAPSRPCIRPLVCDAPDCQALAHTARLHSDATTHQGMWWCYRRRRIRDMVTGRPGTEVRQDHNHNTSCCSIVIILLPLTKSCPSVPSPREMPIQANHHPQTHWWRRHVLKLFAHWAVIAQFIAQPPMELGMVSSSRRGDHLIVCKGDGCHETRLGMCCHKPSGHPFTTCIDTQSLLKGIDSSLQRLTNWDYSSQLVLTQQSNTNR